MKCLPPKHLHLVSYRFSAHRLQALQLLVFLWITYFGAIYVSRSEKSNLNKKVPTKVNQKKIKGLSKECVDQYLVGFLIFAEISEMDKLKPTRKTCFSREMKRLGRLRLRICHAKFCWAAFL